MFIKKTTNEKKFCTFLIKKLPKTTFLCWTKLKTEKPLATAKNQLIRKNSVFFFEKSGNFFHRVNVQIGLNPPSPCSFLIAF